MHDDVATAQAEQQGHQRDKLLRADGRHDVGDSEIVNASTPGVPLDDRLAQHGGAGGLRVRVRIGCRRECGANEGRGFVDGRTDREIDHPAAACSSNLGEWGKRIPGKFREREGHFS